MRFFYLLIVHLGTTDKPFMYHHIFQPQQALRDMVNHIMVFQHEFDPSEAVPSILLPPMPEQCLYFYPKDSVEASYLTTDKKLQLYTCSLAGPQTTGVRLRLGYQHMVIKISFQPGALFRLLRIPMNELLRIEAFDGVEVMGKSMRDLTLRIQEAKGIEEMITAIEAYLLQQRVTMKERLPIDAVLPVLIQKGGLLSIDKLAASACLSNRQFERVFKQRIGLSPKFFSRLVRFANAWVLRENDTTRSWTNIAYASGYYDQMHMIRDFKEFAGTNPKEIEQAFSKMAFNPGTQLFI